MFCKSWRIPVTLLSSENILPRRRLRRCGNESRAFPGKRATVFRARTKKKKYFFQKPKFFSDSLFRFLRVFCSLLGWWWVMKKGQLSQTFSDLGSGGPQFPGKFSRGIRGILDSRVFFIRRVYGQPREVSWDYKSLPLSLFVRKIIIKRRKRGEGWEGDAAFENQGHEEHPLLHRSWPCQSLKYKDCFPNKNRRKPFFKNIVLFISYQCGKAACLCTELYTPLAFFCFFCRSLSGLKNTCGQVCTQFRFVKCPRIFLWEVTCPKSLKKLPQLRESLNGGAKRGSRDEGVGGAQQQHRLLGEPGYMESAR